MRRSSMYVARLTQQYLLAKDEKSAALVQRTDLGATDFARVGRYLDILAYLYYAGLVYTLQQAYEKAEDVWQTVRRPPFSRSALRSRPKA